MALRSVHEEGRECQRSRRTVRLGRVEIHRDLKRLSHASTSGFEVDVLPPKTEDLAEPHPGAQCDQDRELDVRRRHGVQERSGLPHRDRKTLHPGRVVD